MWYHAGLVYLYLATVVWAWRVTLRHRIKWWSLPVCNIFLLGFLSIQLEPVICIKNYIIHENSHRYCLSKKNKSISQYKDIKTQSCGNIRAKVQVLRRRIYREGKPLLNRDGLMCIYMFSIDTTTDTNIHILHYGASDGLPGNQL